MHTTSNISVMLLISEWQNTTDTSGLTSNISNSCAGVDDEDRERELVYFETFLSSFYYHGIPEESIWPVDPSTDDSIPFEDPSIDQHRFDRVLPLHFCSSSWASKFYTTTVPKRRPIIDFEVYAPTNPVAITTPTKFTDNAIASASAPAPATITTTTAIITNSSSQSNISDAGNSHSEVDVPEDIFDYDSFQLDDDIPLSSRKRPYFEIEDEE
ncbi:MAG: hypothetical protein EXX96DRAFT_629927 [Benjaminiella poitrasii]|nr:MAG: hypothetical protein EXX96DRAFT_629927 [Benjaminiella poitrasii]